MDKEKIRKTLLELGFKIEEFLWQLIKMHGTCNQRRALEQLHDDIETELQGQKH